MLSLPFECLLPKFVISPNLRYMERGYMLVHTERFVLDHSSQVNTRHHNTETLNHQNVRIQCFKHVRFYFPPQRRMPCTCQSPNELTTVWESWHWMSWKETHVKGYCILSKGSIGTRISGKTWQHNSQRRLRPGERSPWITESNRQRRWWGMDSDGGVRREKMVRRERAKSD